ncbi:MAG: TonB-dependent receptor [Cellvibrionaceae bacterium]|nr:TonB-dependent receptor [Cellvibrionaceae bacterium]
MRYLNNVFNTGSIQHNLTMGISGDTSTQHTHTTNYVYGENFVIPTNITLEQFMSMEMPTGLHSTDYGPRYKSNDTENRNIVMSDSITFNQQWSAIVGVNDATIKTQNISSFGITTSEYDDSALTTTASVIYKPITKLSIYISAIEGLEAGGAVPDDSEIYNNPGEILEPFISTQYELGAKYAPNEDIVLSSSVFNIEPPRVYRRLTFLRELAYEQETRIFTRSTRARSTPCADERA